MSTPSQLLVRVTRHIPFPAERVFDAWLDPALAKRWLFATPTGEMVRAEVDARVGGNFNFTERRHGEDVEHTGEYLEINRPRRLVFTFGVPKYSPDFSKVMVEITPHGGNCELILTQEMLPQWEQWWNRTQDGWTQMVSGLAAALGDKRAATNRAFGEITAPDEVSFVRLLPGPIERVWEYFTESGKRGQWFASGPLETKVGGKLILHFKHRRLSPHESPPEKYREVHDPGVTMSAEVSQFDPPRRFAFLWEEGPGRSTEVIFDLTPQGDEVRLVLTHRRLKDRAEMSNVSTGWHLHTAMLDGLLSGNTPPPLWAAHQRLEGEYGNRMHEQTG